MKLNIKTPEKDGVAWELIKNAGDALHNAIHILIKLVWNSETIPEAEESSLWS